MTISEDGPDVRVLSTVQRKRAAKEYTCTFCGQPIKVGTPYCRAAILEDGKFKAEKWHASVGIWCFPE